MGFSEVTPGYVNTLTSNKYASRTSDSENFEALKAIYQTYINPKQVPSRKVPLALALLIAHHYAMDDTKDPDSGGSDTSIGPVTTEKIGDRTEVRGMMPYVGTVAGHNYHLLQSRWGVQYLNLLKTFKPSPRVT